MTTITRTNLFTNPNMEISRPYGGNNITVVRPSTEDFFTGSSSYKITCSGGSFSSFSVSLASLDGNSTYTASMYIKATTGAAVKLRAQTWTTSYGRFDTQYSADFIATGNWQRISHTWTTASDIVDGEIGFEIDPLVGTVVVFLDAMLLEKSDTLMPYFDGSTPGASWTGSPNLSTSTMQYTIPETTNKNFKVKNGLEVLGTFATVDGNDVLTTASSIAALADVDLTGAIEGNSLVFDASLNLIPGEGAGGGIAKYYVSDTRPLNPQEGLVWYNSTSGEAFIYIEDIDSSQWVEIGGMGPTGPQGPQGADSTVPGPQGDQGESGIVAQAEPPSDTSVLWYDTDAPGFGIPLGGSVGQVLAKIDAEDFNTEWVTPYGDEDVALLIDNAPTTLNTLGKIAASIGNDDNFEATVQSALDQKADTVHTHQISNIFGLQDALDLKSNSSHNHNTVYYTKDESNDLLSFKADTTHNHDNRYYTETEMNIILQGKADEEHTHVVSDITDIQGPLNTLQENIDLKADILHSHSIDQITNLQTVLDSKTDNNHIHDTRYYTETEIDDKLALKATLDSSPTFTGTVAAPIINATTSIGTVALAASGAVTVGTTLDVNGAASLKSTLGVTGATTLSSTLAVTGATTLSSTLNVSGTVTATGNVNPQATNSYDLGTSSLRWRNIYTQDLHLSNGIGDYTVIEGVEELYLVNNNSGKHFKFALIEVDPSEVPAKSESD